MLNDWFQDVEFEISWATFQKLPRHPAFRYEYLSERCRVSPRPRYYHARFNLESWEPQTSDSICNEVVVESLGETNCDDLHDSFLQAFARTVPFCQLSESERRRSVHQLLERTFSGLDGPLHRASSHVLRERASGIILGASLITLLPSEDLERFDHPDWRASVPSDAAETNWGFPHLTWIFVASKRQRLGLSSCLLDATVSRLKDRGDRTLLSTFLLGNDQSLLWHWKMGFQLLSHVSSV
ncbi:hypothetical protein KOR42_24310 [Thalassoglobus neptunius]|uniref:N-acetyltransferase domain-containing protein n=1 Tax=Thalassoglobus neptunius TaxID=1938619 RepID=A0A5C5XAX6_9PLAN|nr:GNAT family N-acetyltransferase [Thalassoglobus neptunius]TWT59042.1 hypothetical protein KOR42_24310 [Thalassoglobus neptunius]